MGDLLQILIGENNSIRYAIKKWLTEEKSGVNWEVLMRWYDLIDTSIWYLINKDQIYREAYVGKF